jgi:hypothetical protein
MLVTDLAFANKTLGKTVSEAGITIVVSSQLTVRRFSGAGSVSIG